MEQFLNAPTSKSSDILEEKLIVINIGLDVFMDSLSKQGVEVLNIRWKPPYKPPADLEEILQKLL
jgi:hypothetical protein